MTDTHESGTSYGIRGLVVRTDKLLPLVDRGVWISDVFAVTPEEAGSILQDRNPSNRRLRRRDVANHVRDIVAGDWKPNGETIKFDRDGDLLDGQHRLAAILAAGITAPSLVVMGLNPDVQSTVDIGIRRTDGDRYTLRGEKNSMILAAALRLIWMWEVREDRKLTKTYKPTPAEQDRLLAEHPEIRDSAVIARATYSKFPQIPQSVLALTHYLLANVDEDDADWFFARIADGVDLHEHHPVITLRNRAIKERRGPSPRALPTSLWVGYIFRAWNAFRDGRNLAQITHPYGTDVPTPK